MAENRIAKLLAGGPVISQVKESKPLTSVPPDFLAPMTTTTMEEDGNKSQFAFEMLGNNSFSDNEFQSPLIKGLDTTAAADDSFAFSMIENNLESQIPADDSFFASPVKFTFGTASNLADDSVDASFDINTT